MLFVLAALCIPFFFYKVYFVGYKLSPEMLLAVFSHADVQHLFFNLAFMLLFGFIVQKIIGRKEMLFLFIATTFAGFAAHAYFHPFLPALGISAFVFGLIGALAVLKPKLILYTPLGFMPILLLAVIYALLEFLSFGTGNIGHEAHFFGLIVGAAFGLVHRYASRFIPAFLLVMVALPTVYMVIPHELPECDAQIFVSTRSLNERIEWFKQFCDEVYVEDDKIYGCNITDIKCGDLELVGNVTSCDDPCLR